MTFETYINGLVILITILLAAVVLTGLWLFFRKDEKDIPNCPYPGLCHQGRNCICRLDHPKTNNKRSKQ